MQQLVVFLNIWLEFIKKNTSNPEQIIISIAFKGSKKSKTAFNRSTFKKSMVWKTKNFVVPENPYKFCGRYKIKNE